MDRIAKEPEADAVAFGDMLLCESVIVRVFDSAWDMEARDMDVVEESEGEDDSLSVSDVLLEVDRTGLIEGLSDAVGDKLALGDQVCVGDDDHCCVGVNCVREREFDLDRVGVGSVDTECENDALGSGVSVADGENDSEGYGDKLWVLLIDLETEDDGVGDRVDVGVTVNVSAAESDADGNVSVCVTAPTTVVPTSPKEIATVMIITADVTGHVAKRSCLGVGADINVTKYGRRKGEQPTTVM